MSPEFTLDLDAFETESLQFGAGPGELSLESLLGGQAMAEVAASCAPVSGSCCIACCCCCFS